MDYKLFLTTFAAIFVAEFGDKTQLAVFSLASGSSSRWTVFAAAATALLVSTAIAVLAGDLITRVLPAIWLRRAAGVLFVGLGLLFLLSRAEA